MSQCGTCQQKPGEFICIQPECVKTKDNQMVCYSCYWQQHKQHQPQKFSDICSLATENCNLQIKILEQMINSTTQQLINLESILENQKQIYISWHDQQKKLIKVYIDTQNQKLQIRIKEVQSVLQQQNLDSMLNYCLINVNQQEGLFQKANQQSNFERQFQVNELQARISFIKDLKFSLSDFSNIFVEMPQANIPKAQEKSTIQYQQCNTHQKPQKYLCIHKDCISYKSAFPFHCESCFTDVHKQHDFKTYAKKYKFIKQEQDEKTQLINNEQETIKCYIQQEFNKNCELIQKQQQEKMKKYEQIKRNMLQIKEQSIDHLNKLFNFKFIQNNINISLLSKTIEQIKQLFSIEYKNFCQKMSMDLQKEAREIIKFSANLDQKYEKEQNEIILLHQELKSKNDEIDKLKKELTLKEKLISQYKNCSNKLYLIQNSHKYIQQLIDELAKSIREKMNGWNNFSNLDKYFFFKSFETNFKDIKAQISQTDLTIENIINEYRQLSNNQGTQTSNTLPVNDIKCLTSQYNVQNPKPEINSNFYVSGEPVISIPTSRRNTEIQIQKSQSTSIFQYLQPERKIQFPLKNNNG